MGYSIQKSNTVLPLVFLLIAATDHRTGLTGATPAVSFSKNGAAFAGAAGAVTEIGHGWYQVAANATDAGTLGTLILHAEAAGADPLDEQFAVVDYNPVEDIASILSRVSSFGGAVVYAGPVAQTGDVVLRVGYAYEPAWLTSLQWSASTWADHSHADTLELWDSAGMAIGSASLTSSGDTQTVTVTVTSEETLILPMGLRLYILRARFGTELVELANGNLRVTS